MKIKEHKLVTDRGKSRPRIIEPHDPVNGVAIAGNALPHGIAEQRLIFDKEQSHDWDVAMR